MTGQARKDLELRVKVTGDAAQGAKALKDVEVQAMRASAAVGGLNERLRFGGAAGGPRTQLGQAGGAALGAAGGVFGGGGVATALAGAAALTATAASLGEALGRLDNHLLTTRQKVLGLAESIPLVGPAIASTISDAQLTLDRLGNPDRARRLDALRMRQPVLAGGMALFDAGKTQADALERETLTARFAERATALVPLQSTLDLRAREAGGLGGFLAGVEQFRRDPRQTAAAEALQQAERGRTQAELDADRAAEVLEAQAGVADRAQQAEAAARKKAEAALARARGQAVPGADAFTSSEQLLYGTTRFSGGKSNPDPAGRGLEEAQREHQLAQIAAEQELRRLERDGIANKERQLALARAEAEVARAQTNVLKTNLELTREEEQRVKGAARQFGGMAENEQYALQDALRRFKAGGKEGVARDELQLLLGSGLTGKYVSEQLEADASGNAVFKALLKQTNQRDLDVIRAERDALTTKIQGKLELDERQAKEVMRKAVEEINEDLVGLIRRIVDVQFNKLQTDVEMGQTMRSQ